MKRITGMNWQLYSFFTGIMLIIINCLNCTPKQVIIEVPTLQSERYFTFNAKMVKEEIQRLEKIWRDTTGAEPDSIDTTLSREEILTNLFDLSIHRRNPEPDYHKAYAYAALLYKTKTKDRLYYLNWGCILSNYFQLTVEKDSLLAEKDSLLLRIEKASKSNQSLQYNSRKQTKQIDSLSVLIKGHKETIEKLKNLDLMLERQRSTIRE